MFCRPNRPTPASHRALGKIGSRDEICRLNVAEQGQSIRIDWHSVSSINMEFMILTRTYEVDYLISPSLGGSDDLQKSLAEPYAKGVWNANVKDALEDRLHELVCDGRIELSTAQQDIA
jgi:hypothetical protein